MAFYLTECKAGIFVKRVFGGNFDQMVLDRLDRLTLDEARVTASQTVKVVYGLVQNMRVVMDGKQTDSACHPLALRNSPFRRKVIHGRYLGFPGYCIFPVPMSYF